MKLFCIILYAGIMYELAPIISPAAIIGVNVLLLIVISLAVMRRHAN